MSKTVKTIIFKDGKPIKETVEKYVGKIVNMNSKQAQFKKAEDQRKH